MGIFKKIIRPAVDEQENRRFRLKYEKFRELLDRNNEVLETISLLGKVWERDQWISLVKLSSLITRTAVIVYRLIENLNFISDDQYKSLNGIFAELEKKIIAKLDIRPQGDTGLLSVNLAQADPANSSDLGAKASNLAAAARIAGIKVPRGVALTTNAYAAFMDHNGLLKRIKKELLLMDPEDGDGLTGLARRLKELITNAELPGEISAHIHEAYVQLRGDADQPAPMVIRSSAVGEDAPGSSFAGLFQSIINPPADELEHAYKSVVASKFSQRVLTYFMQKGMYQDLYPMGVLIMQLVPAKAGGVMFTRDSQAPDDAMVISAVWGLGKPAVEGSLTPDIFRISRDERLRVTEARAGHKPYGLEPGPKGGVVEFPVNPELQDEPCLNEDQLLRLARLGLMLEDSFGSPQDVEWCLDHNGEINIVQCRPLMTYAGGGSWSDFYPWDEMAGAAEPLVKGLRVGNIGVASGPAVFLQHPQQAADLAAGSVAVVSQTAPDFVGLLPKAAAVAAQRGNINGHLAIIAREFKVPLVIGLSPEQTDLLLAQDQVTLDAFRGVIHGGRLEPLLEFARVMEQQTQTAPSSPLRALLDEVLQYVTPLNLVDPRDPSFRPQSIRTIHDIIRFAHEKAINAMFNINDDRLMSRGKVVRLVSKVPLDIYLIDLGGGISEGAPPKKIKPEDITSVPMLALYQGMTTPGVRWSGHVPIDFRSFVSVFSNTMFDGAKYERKLGDRSYAIVSHNYVNFSSRLGYHFSIVDAYLGREENDNYISFRFKGGAARLEKRTRRVRFLGEVLKRWGFWVDQKADLVNARIKHLPRPEMEEKLRMVGRLMGCSRQLDVTMYNEQVIDRYIELFMQGDYSMGYGRKIETGAAE